FPCVFTRLSLRGGGKVRLGRSAVVLCLGLISTFTLLAKAPHGRIGEELSIPVHLQDGEEFRVSIRELVTYGRQLFDAMCTSQEGAGRPLTKGTGAPLSDASDPLTFPRNFNRVSGPDTNSCSGCHNKPSIGGGGDIV